MIFRRSLVSELANSAGGVFTVLFSIVLTVGLVRILNQAAGGKADSAMILEMAVYSSLTNLPPLLALTLFISVLMVLMRAWQDNEMVVWFSSGGLSLLEWIRPVMRFALPLVAVIAVLSIVVTPWANGQIERASESFKQRDDVNRVSPGRFIETQGGRRVFFIEEVSPDGTHVKNIFMSERHGNRETILQAREGEFKSNKFGDRYVVLKDGRRYRSSDKPDAAWQVMDFAQYELLLETKVDSVYVNQDEDTAPITELFAKRNPVNDSQILWRLCWPLAALNLVLLAIPLSYTNPRAGRSLSLVIAVLIFILYLNGITMAETWVKTSKISWISGILAVNGLMFFIAVMLIVRRVWMERWLPLWLTELPYRLFRGAK